MLNIVYSKIGINCAFDSKFSLVVDDTNEVLERLCLQLLCKFDSCLRS